MTNKLFIMKPIENLFVYEEFPTRQEIKNNHMKYKKDLFLEKFKKITNK